MRINLSKSITIRTMVIILCLCTCLLFVGCADVTLQQEGMATLVLKNGAVYTVEDDNPTAEAIAVIGDEIVYVGDNSGVEKFIDESTEVIDLEQKMVLPGFFDSHIHVPTDAIAKVNDVYLSDVLSKEEYLLRINEYVESHPDAEIIAGGGWAFGPFGDEGPQKEDLDAISSEKPIALYSIDHHAVWVNSKTLEMAGITKETKDPQGGLIQRKSDGTPSGALVDTAMSLIDEVAGIKYYSDQQFLEAFKYFQELSHSFGIVGAQSLSSGIDDQRAWELVKTLEDKDELKIRISAAYNVVPETDVEETISIMNQAKKFNSDWLKVQTVKLFVDGVVEGKTGLLLEPYAPEAEMPEEYKGEKIWNDDILFKMVNEVDEAGYQMHIHTIADGGVNQALNAIEDAFKNNGKRDARHTFAHVTLIDENDIPRMAELGVIAAMQPPWMYKDPFFYALEEQMLGKERAERMYVIRDMADAGIIISGGSDNPVTPDYRPLTGIEIGVTRNSPYTGEQGKEEYSRRPDQNLTVMEMIEAYTINAAYQMFMEDVTGSIKVGKKADFVILENDITKIDPQQISETEIIYTISGGDIVYSLK